MQKRGNSSSFRPFYRRPIFGTVRYVSLKAAAKKFDAGEILERYLERGSARLRAAAE
jgi:hypothetical protein